MAAGKKKKGEDSGDVAQTAMANHLCIGFLRSGKRRRLFQPSLVGGVAAAAEAAAEVVVAGDSPTGSRRGRGSPR